MLRFDLLEPNRLYRTSSSFSLPPGKKTREKGNVVTVLSDDIDKTVKFFQRRYIDTVGYLRYHLPLRISFTPTNKLIREVLEQADLYAEGMGESGLNMSLMRTPAMIKDYNVVSELAPYISLMNGDKTLNNYTPTRKALTRCETIIDILTKEKSEFTSDKLPNKYLYIPVHDYTDNPSDPTLFNKKNLGNLLVDIVFTMSKHPGIFSKLHQWTFVFSNVNELFFIDMSVFKDVPGNLTEAIEEYLEMYPESLTEAVGEDDETIGSLLEASRTKWINPTKIIKNLFKKFKSTLNEVNMDNTSDDTEEITKKAELVDEVSNKVKNLPVSEKGAARIIKTENKAIKSGKDSNVDRAVKKEMSKEIDAVQAPFTSGTRNARLAKIQSEMKDLKIDGKSIEDITMDTELRTIETTTFDHVDVINPDMKSMTYINFNKGYNEKLGKYDLAQNIQHFSTLRRPLIPIKIVSEDTSTPQDKKITYKITYEDEFGKRHNFVIDYPKIINDEYMFLNGSYKRLITQKEAMPILKIGPDRVQITSDYNKLFVKRVGQKLSPKINKFNKIVGDIPNKIMTVKRGNSMKVNLPFMTTLEYDELAKTYTFLKFKDVTIYLNQPTIRSLCEENGLKFKDSKELPFAIEEKGGKKKLITLNPMNDKITGTQMSPIDYIISLVSSDVPTFRDDFAKINPGKRFIYSRVKIMAKEVPTILLLSFLYGMEEVMFKAKIKYTFSETRPKLSTDEKLSKMIVRFADGYLVYDQYPFANSLLMNGLAELPVSEYNFMDFNDRQTYYELFQKLYGNKNLGYALDNFEELLLYPIVREVLEDNNLPSDFVGVLMYANSLLENNATDDETLSQNKRYRKHEVINAHMYKIMATAYEKYKATADNKNPHKFTVRQNALISVLQQSELSENAAMLSPIYDAERSRCTTVKGIAGVNQDRAMTIQKRGFNETMLGVDAASSPISANIGVSRTMSVDPNITSLRGYAKPGSEKTANQLKGTSLLSPAEMLAPFAASGDDAPRLSMMAIQSRHTRSTLKSDVALFGYGYDKMLAYTTSDHFAFKSKQKGVIESIDEKTGIIVLKYEDGTKDIVNIAPREEKNTSGGGFITIKLDTPYQVGHEFGPNTVIAYDDNFYYYNKRTDNVIFRTGRRVMSMFSHNSRNFEDAGRITRRYADDLSSFMTSEKSLTLGTNATVYKIANIGDQVEVGDSLITFDESIGDSDFTNQMIANMTAKVGGDVFEATRTNIESKYDGVVADIKVFYTVDKEMLSDSIREQIIDPIEKLTKKRQRIFKMNNIDQSELPNMLEQVGKTTPVNNKIKGIDMGEDTVLVLFYIRTLDGFKIGDKITLGGVALKNIVSDVIPYGKEPYLLGEPERKIDVSAGIIGTFARKVTSYPKAGVLNHGILQLEKNLVDLYEEHIGKLNIPKGKYW